MKNLPCAKCRQRSTGTAWGVPLCDAHFAAWAETAPTSGAIEAAAKPDLVESALQTEYLGRVVVLKPGVLERSYRLWTERWISHAQRGTT